MQSVRVRTHSKGLNVMATRSAAQSAALGMAVCLYLVMDPLFASAPPKLPKGTAPKMLYGGFFPTEKWIRSLVPVPRDRRSNPQLVQALRTLNGEDVEKLERLARPFLKVAPEDLLGLVPRRNRLAGNARVMPTGGRLPAYPVTGKPLVWTPDRPDELRDSRGEVVDLHALLPPTGTFRIIGPHGDTQEYPYHDRPNGTRVYLQAEYMDAQRVSCLSQAVRALGILYHRTNDTAYARRAAAILYDFSQAVRHWPKIARGLPYGFEGKERFRPVDEYIRYASLWYDKYHSGIGGDPRMLARGYDLIVRAPVWDWLDAQATGNDARTVIERDLFLVTATDAIRYDVHFPHPESALSNYIPYQARGLICIGAAIGVPELVHYATWKIEQMVEKTLMVDSVFPEGPSYARQHVVNMQIACQLGMGYSDPIGFTSTIDGRRYDRLDVLGALPALRRAVDTLATMTYPNGKYITVDDTHWMGAARHTPHERVQSVLFPAYSHAILGRGEETRGDRFQAHLNFSGNWGHDHRDMLGLILWLSGEDLICDIGYVHTYRQYATGTSGHNTVTVDRHAQQRVNDPGRLLAWHPARNGVQVVAASASHVYPQTSVYRRTLALIPVADDNLVLDLFEVQGGRTHEWMAHGCGSIDQTLSVSQPLDFFGDSYADDGKPFLPPDHNQYVKERIAQGLPKWNLDADELDPWYGVFRDVRRGTITGPFEAEFASDGSALADVRLHVLEPTDGQVFAATVPGCRRGAANDMALVEKVRMPKLILRRDGQSLSSRFVVLWEPVRGRRLVKRVSTISTSDAALTGVQIETADPKIGTFRVFHASDPSKALQTDSGHRLVGRVAVTASGAASKSVWLYDCTRFCDGDVDVQIEPRCPLPVLEVRVRDDGAHEIVLEGVWDDLADGRQLSFDPPEMVTLTQNGDFHRPIPVVAATRQGQQMRLSCRRHPGFRYDRDARRLVETFSPYRTIEGSAFVALPNRAVLERKTKDPDDRWQVVASNPLTVNGNKIRRTDKR